MYKTQVHKFIVKCEKDDGATREVPKPKQNYMLKNRLFQIQKQVFQKLDANIQLPEELCKIISKYFCIDTVLHNVIRTSVKHSAMHFASRDIPFTVEQNVYFDEKTKKWYFYHSSSVKHNYAFDAAFAEVGLIWDINRSSDEINEEVLKDLRKEVVGDAKINLADFSCRLHTNCVRYMFNK